jgi:primase-polymerase (primpol)-like protein
MTDRDRINSQVEIEKATREALHVNFENIPEPLKILPYWVGWKYSLDEKGNLKKPPFNLRTGNGASHSNPATWSEFETAKEAYQEGKYTGTLQLHFLS